MKFTFPKIRPLAWLYIAGAVALAVAGVLWCYKANTNPERVFWQTIERGLTVRGVTITQEPSSGTTTRYSLGAANLSHSVTKHTQQGTTVKNEMIGTPTADYLRYTDVKTDQTKADGSPIDFSPVLGVWAKSEEGAGQFFVQAMFGGALPVGGLGVPIGNLSPDVRAELLQQIHNSHVYQPNFSAVEKMRVDGRLQYVYDVEVQPVAYVAMMKSFAQAVGLHGLDRLDPNTYEGQPAFTLRITVDVWARHVVHITTPESTGGQSYSGYDIPVQARPPKDVISGSELQRRLSELQ